MQQRYHTNLKIKYALGMLNTETASHIPASTKHYWKSMDVNTFFGCDDPDWDKSLDTIKYAYRRKGIFRFIRVIKNIEQTVNSVFDQIGKTSNLYRDCKSSIVETIDKIKNTTGFDTALNIFKITHHQYRFWKKGSICKSSRINLCRKIYYNQLSVNEINSLKNTLFAPDTLHWPLVSRYYQMMRNNTAYLSLSTFYKYAKLLGASTRIKPKDSNPRVGLRALKPLQIIHTDLTELRIKDNLKVYVSLVVDNFSRAILAWSIATNKKPIHTMQNLEKVYVEHLKPNTITQLITDGGSEYKGETDDFLRTTHIQKLIAQTDISFSNSMVEAINKKLKYEYWLEPKQYSLSYFIKLTEQSVADYNKRPHGELKGLTPHEALYNAAPCPDYAQEIKSAMKTRIITNKTSSCQLCES